MNRIYPDCLTLEVPEGRAHEPESYLAPEGYTFMGTLKKHGATWWLYQDEVGAIWKMPHFRSPIFLTPISEDEVSGPTTTV